VVPDAGLGADDRTIACNRRGVFGHPIGGAADLRQHLQPAGIIDDKVVVNVVPELAAGSPNPGGGDSRFRPGSLPITVRLGGFFATSFSSLNGSTQFRPMRSDPALGNAAAPIFATRPLPIAKR
jgi:hypothetical protein